MEFRRGGWIGLAMAAVAGMVAVGLMARADAMAARQLLPDDTGVEAAGDTPPANPAADEDSDPKGKPDEAGKEQAGKEEPQQPPAQPKPPLKPNPPGTLRMAKDHDLWVDLKRKVVIVDGQVCLREGQLEMFACPKGTKEHESVVSINCPAQFVHAALLAVGAKPGKPVTFDPKYSPASGTEIDIFILWRDADGKKRQVRAQEWIKHAKTGKPMPYPWVFAGSGHWKDPDTGRVYYHGDEGDFICVSNFPTATLDLPVASSQANADLLFLAFTERIPPKKTPVRLVLRPRLKPKQGDEKKQAPGKQAPGKQAEAAPSKPSGGAADRSDK